MRRFKIFLSLILLVFLCGCVFDSSMSEQMDNALASVIEEECSTVRNNAKKYYSYYLQPCVGKRESTPISNTFALEDDEFVMNLNVSTIVKNTYYQDIDSKMPIVYQRSKSQVYDYKGEAINSNGRLFEFQLAVFELGKNRYLVELNTEYFMFLAKVPLGSVVQIGSEMLRVARTATIEKEAILADYGLTEIVTYEKQKVEIIQQVIPEEGLLEDIMPYRPEQSSSNEETSEENSVQGE